MVDNLDLSAIDIAACEDGFVFDFCRKAFRRRFRTDRLIGRLRRWMLQLFVVLISPAASISATVSAVGSPSKAGIGKVRGCRPGIVDDVEEELSVILAQPRVPRPMICLNSLIEPTTRASTIFRHVGASTPVESNCDVVKITGVFVSTSWNFALWAAADLTFVAVTHICSPDTLGLISSLSLTNAFAHFTRMLLIDAKYDRFRKWIALLYRNSVRFLRNRLRASAN